MGVQSTPILKNLADDDAPETIVESVVSAFSSLDILVLNASVQLPKPWLEAERDDFELQIKVNLRCTHELIKLVVPGMRERQWGRILTIGSVQELKPHPDMLIYAATKCAQTSMVRNLAKQLAPYGIMVNNLAPGAIATDRNTDRLADNEYKQTVLSKIPSGRVGLAEDCVGPALLLCSDAAQYLTGQNLYVDGGMSL